MWHRSGLPGLYSGPGGHVLLGEDIFYYGRKFPPMRGFTLNGKDTGCFLKLWVWCLHDANHLVNHFKKLSRKIKLVKSNYVMHHVESKSSWKYWDKELDKVLKRGGESSSFGQTFQTLSFKPLFSCLPECFALISSWQLLSCRKLSSLNFKFY